MSMNFYDLMNFTLARRPTNKYVETVLPLQRWMFVDHIMKEDAMTDSGGKNPHKWLINYRTPDTTVFAAAASTRNPQLSNFSVEASIDLVDMYWSVSYVEKEVRENTASGQQLANLIDERRKTHLIGHLNNLENKFFALPVTAGDHRTPHSLVYHMPPITTTQVSAGTGEGAFQGQLAGAGTSSTTWCGINRSASKYAGLRTWNFNWSAASAATLTMSDENLRRLSRAFMYSGFQGPMDVADLKTPQYSKFRLFTDELVLHQLGLAMRAQRDDLGSDVLNGLINLGKTSAGVPLVNQLPVEWAPVLQTADTTNRGAHPLYGVNRDQLKVVRERGNWQKKRPPERDGVHRPDVVVEYVDSTWTVKNPNPQLLGFVGSWVATE